MQENILQLGKKLIQELDARHDVTSQWMALYISEKITKAESASGEEKAVAEKQCFETILALWEKRSAMQNRSRPFENFEPILSALEALNPRSSNSYYFRDQLGSNNRSGVETKTETDAWIDSAITVDRAVKTLINFCIDEAISSASEEKNISWLESNMKLPDTDIPRVIIKFLSANGTDDDVESDNKLAISSTQEKLDKLVQLQYVLDKVHEKLEFELINLKMDQKK